MHFLLDCDPGHDDAVALLFAAHHLNLVGVTTVFGNTSIENTTYNALAILSSAKLGHIPIAAGATAPLQGVARSAETVHGKSGLDGANFPAPTLTAVQQPAVDLIIAMSREFEDFTIIATGPLTNIATAITKDPGLAERVKGISIMGGSTSGGNATPAAEFNFFADPEAAKIVFNSSAVITMAGLNVTANFGFDEKDVEQLRHSQSSTASEVAGALGYYLERQASLYKRSFAPLHDLCAVIPFTHPGLIRHEMMHVDIETSGQLTRGMSVCDLRGLSASEGLEPPRPSNANVAISADGDKIIRVVLDTLVKFP